jgi:hypothetical protein
MSDSTRYYFGVDSGESWCNLPYKEALQLKIDLAREVLANVLEVSPLKRDGEKANKILYKIKIIENDLKECR